MAKNLQTALIIPVLNAEPHFRDLLPALRALDPAPDRVLFIDSSSTDRTCELALNAGFEVKTIARSDFSHGGTRNWAASLCPQADILIYMTQDAIPVDSQLVAALLAPFADPLVVHTFARQLPHHDATAAAAFSRHFNYPAHDYHRSQADIAVHGLRAFFSSNSCAAYRRTVFEKVGRFPVDLPVSEDTMTAAKMLLSGYTLHYCASAQVRHSHNYSFSEEFRRYFDVGAAISLSPWYETIGTSVSAEKEGARFVREETAFLLRQGKLLSVLSAFARNVVRFVGFRMGYGHKWLPNWLIRQSTGQKAYWARYMQKGDATCANIQS